MLINYRKKVELAKIGHPKHCNHFVNDSNPDAIGIAVKYGSDKFKDSLIGHKNWLVRRALAGYGNDHHRDMLLHDENPNVRSMVAQRGNLTHAKILSNDLNRDVKAMARFRLKEFKNAD